MYSVPTTKSVQTVSQITFAIQQLLESRFSHIWVKGEISNFKHHSSGHMYFSLKDNRAQISAVMFRGNNAKLLFQPSEGMEVVALAKVTVYAPRGNYQIIISEMVPAGVGDLHQAFEQLKQRLFAEGLFADDHKRPLPQFPKSVGIVTSKTGAAVRDMIDVAKRRHPGIAIYVYNARVQGQGASQDIIAGIQAFEEMNEVDVIIIGRGGGSLEDLWAFNDEALARVIYNATIPIVSAVGHEVDYSISDWVADYRAATPSVASEIVFPEKASVEHYLAQKATDITRLLNSKINLRKQQLERYRKSYGLNRIQTMISHTRQTLDNRQEKIQVAIATLLNSQKEKLRFMETTLEHLNPDAVVKRGYAIVRNEKGDLIQNKNQVKIQEKLNVQLANGILHTRVEE